MHGFLVRSSRLLATRVTSSSSAAAKKAGGSVRSTVVVRKSAGTGENGDVSKSSNYSAWSKMSLQEALRSLEEKRTCGTAPQVMDYNQVLRAASDQWQNPPLLQVDDTLQEMETVGVKPNEYTYAYACRAFAHAPSNVARLMQLKDEAIDTGVDISERIGTEILKGFSNSKQPDMNAAFSFFNDYIGKRSAYDYGYLLRAIAADRSGARDAKKQAEKVKLIQQVEEMMVEAEMKENFAVGGLARAYLSLSPPDFSKVIAILKECDSEAIAEELLNACASDPTHIDTVADNLTAEQASKPKILTALIKAYASCTPPRVEEAENAFGSIVNLEEKGHPNRNAHLNLLRAYSAANPEKSSSALKLLEDMESRGHKPGSKGYFYVLKACASSPNGNVDNAQQVFSKMEKAGITPDGFSVGMLLKSYARSGCPLAEFEAMHQKLERLYGVHSMGFYIALDVYANQPIPPLDKMNALWKRMEDNGVKPLGFHYNTRLKAVTTLCQLKRQPLSAISDILEEIETKEGKVEPYSYSLALKGYRGLGAVREEEVLMQKVQEKSITLPNIQ